MQKQIENVMTIINYIEDHLTENPDLDTIAEAMHYSKYHMHRVFAEETSDRGGEASGFFGKADYGNRAYCRI